MIEYCLCRDNNYNCEYNEPQFLSSIDVFDKKISNLELKEKNKRIEKL